MCPLHQAPSVHPHAWEIGVDGWQRRPERFTHTPWEIKQGRTVRRVLFRFQPATTRGEIHSLAAILHGKLGSPATRVGVIS